MSEAAEIRLEPATDVEMRAALWLEQRHFGTWDLESENALNAWLTQSWENRVAYWRLDAAWERTQRLAALRGGIEEASSQDMRRLPGLPILMGIAAALALLAILGWNTTRIMAPPAAKTYETALGGHEVIKFADGTRIELNTNTVIRTRMTTAERTVWLDRGEAYFEVRHDSAHPFRVITGKNVITDIGTKFVVRKGSDHLRVALLSGRVRFGAANGAVQSVLMSPGDLITATADSIAVTKESAAAISKALSWRHGVLEFDNALLADVAAEFNRYDVDKIVVRDPAVASMRVTGTFRTGNSQAFITTVRRVFALHVERNGKSVVISR